MPMISSPIITANNVVLKSAGLMADLFGLTFLFLNLKATKHYTYILFTPRMNVSLKYETIYPFILLRDGPFDMREGG